MLACWTAQPTTRQLVHNLLGASVASDLGKAMGSRWQQLSLKGGTGGDSVTLAPARSVSCTMMSS